MKRDDRWGLIVNIFLGVEIFSSGVENFSGGVGNFSGGVEIFSEGVEIFSGVVEIFQEGLKFFREGFRFFRVGLRYVKGVGVEKFLGRLWYIQGDWEISREDWNFLRGLGFDLFSQGVGIFREGLRFSSIVWGCSVMDWWLSNYCGVGEGSKNFSERLKFFQEGFKLFLEGWNWDVLMG